MNRYKFDEAKHVHLLDEKPLFGTSTVVQVLSKNLTWWAAELAAITALESGEHLPTIRAEYLLACAAENKKKEMDKLQKKYPIFKKSRFAHYEKKNETAEKGIDLHWALEQTIKCKMGLSNEMTKIPAEGLERIAPFVAWQEENVKKWLWSEAYCYSEKLWVGGICDAGALLKDGTIALIDFKSAKEAYLGHFLQCAGYCIEIEENGLFDKNGNMEDNPCKPAIEKFIIFPFGAKELKPWENKLPIGDYKQGFMNAVGLHKLMTFDKKED